MTIKIKRQDCINKYPKFPLRWYDKIKDEEEFRFPKVFQNYILTFSSKSFKGHVRSLGKELTKLVSLLEFDTLIFLGDTEIPWLHQNNDYKPMKDATQFLVDNGVGKRFNGALQIDRQELQDFIRHLSWLSRCNASLPYVYFMDTRQNILGTICKYGNIHLSTLTKDMDKHFSNAISLTQLTFVKGGNCSEQFSKTAAIRGRRIAN